ncbi:uncharacterized protein IL334_001136 [Kwoniella shivajii]|uniref:Uncharacterized protein n=1 Tax=Kwoniella shivajii TaxID=564305 RepID=A0ABZ1CR44_9TREE|nr:hypothetical protein IL334_001136 [Kwoniella shivajii]
MSDSLWIPDSSPLIFYSPAEVYFSGQNLASWVGNNGSQGNVTGNVNGSGETNTFHSSVGHSAIVLPSIYAKSFTPLFSSPEGYDVTIQTNSDAPYPLSSGQKWVAPNDDFNPQTFTLNFQCGKQGGCAEANVEGQIDFLGTWIETEFSPDGSQMESVDLDDASPLIQYEGFAPVDQNNKIVEVDGQLDYEKTLSMTSTQGATAQVTFNGASILLYGVTCPSCGVFTITLDGSSSPSATLNSFNNVTTHNTLLFFATNLNTASSHTIEIEAKGGVVLDKIEVRGPKGAVGFSGNANGSPTSMGPSSSITPTNTSNNGTSGSSPNASGVPASPGGSPNVGVIIGAILGSIAGVGFLWFLCRKVAPRMKKPADKKLNPWDEANLLQNMKNEEVHVTTAANQRYVYPGLIAHSDLKKK